MRGLETGARAPGPGAGGSERRLPAERQRVPEPAHGPFLLPIDPRNIPATESVEDRVPGRIHPAALLPHAPVRGPMKILATRKDQQNRAVFDPWTVVHFGAGLALGLMEVPLAWALSLATAYEVAEQAVERQDWGRELFNASGPEIPGNAVADLAVFAVGHGLGKAWNRRT